ncbi:MAG: hypothetical protein PHS30_07995 [Bacteroidales bacterium]|nr:hypothetical protein [Bacteroidales bacterium]
MKYVFAIIFSLITSRIYGGNIALNGSFWQKDGRSIALGGGINAIDQSASREIAISYFLPYHLSEISTRSIKLAYHTKWMNMNGLWSQTGDAVYLEDYLALGASRSLSGSFILGAKAGYYHYAFISEEKGSAWLSEIHCSYKPYEKMQINIYLFNPTGSKIKQAGKENFLSQSFHFGGSFYPAKNTEWVVELEKEQQEELIWHVGFEYGIGDIFFIRTGFSVQPLKPSLGIGGQIHHFKYAFGGNIHPVLGFSSCFSLYYNW